jgi:hypothetical protein
LGIEKNAVAENVISSDWRGIKIEGVP